MTLPLLRGCTMATSYQRMWNVREAILNVATDLSNGAVKRYFVELAQCREESVASLDVDVKMIRNEVDA